MAAAGGYSAASDVISERVERWRREAVEEFQRSDRASATGPDHVWEFGRTVSPVGMDERSARNELTQPLQATSRTRRGKCLQTWSRWWLRLQGWVLMIVVGVCTSLSGCVIELGVRRLSSMRFGWCGADPFADESHCPPGHWTAWGHGAGGFVAFTAPGAAMAAASATLVFLFAPAAAGSGIPEVKSILNGFVMSDVVAPRTLAVKVPGLILSVAAGMALGKEGPLVHVAICWGNMLSGFFPLFRSEGARLEVFSAAAAAGVSAAFGAPLGGVLFSLEEVSSSFPSRTLLRSFTAAVAAAVVLQVANLTGTGRLTMFSADVKQAIAVVELPAFVTLGVLGGLVGALFNSLNFRWSQFRMRPSFRQIVHPVVEVTALSIVTLLSSWPLALTQPLSSEVIHALFGTCGTNDIELRSRLGICTPEGNFPPASSSVLATLLLAALVRLMQLTLTFGTKCPAGLFVPSLYIGACLGRLVGMVMKVLMVRPIQPGVYAMVGAAAVLGGVCRVTISLVVIMLELTGGLTYVVPFMLAVLVAKMVGDSINEGIYDLYVVLKGYPFLHEEIDVTFTERCCDIMETGLIKVDICLQPRPADLRAMLHTFRFRGYPVVHGPRFIGYVRRHRLKALLDKLEFESGEHTVIGLSDMLSVTDRDVMRMVPDASLDQAHNVFKQLGYQRIFLVGTKGGVTSDVEELQGILTKKNFIQFLKSGKVGHMPLHTGNAIVDAGRIRIAGETPVADGATDSPGGNVDAGLHGLLRFSLGSARRQDTLRRISLNQLSSLNSNFDLEESPEPSLLCTAGPSQASSLVPTPQMTPQGGVPLVRRDVQLDVLPPTA